MSQSYLIIGWEQLHRDARVLAEKLMEEGPWKGIVAVTRGGMIPAAIIAREIGCRLIDTISIASYDEEVQHEPVILKNAAIAGDGEGFLVIDDLVDTGLTAKFIRNSLPKAKIACLYAKPNGRDLADFYTMEVTQETWLLFPWDTALRFEPPLVSTLSRK